MIEMRKTFNICPSFWGQDPEARDGDGSGWVLAMVIYSPKSLWEFSVQARITYELHLDSHESLTSRDNFSQHLGVP